MGSATSRARGVPRIFHKVCAEFGVDEQLKLAVPQQVLDGVHVDASDRVQAGADLRRELAAAGL
jgi:hypothetical protein